MIQQCDPCEWLSWHLSHSLWPPNRQHHRQTSPNEYQDLCDCVRLSEQHPEYFQYLKWMAKMDQNDWNQYVTVDSSWRRRGGKHAPICNVAPSSTKFSAINWPIFVSCSVSPRPPCDGSGSSMWAAKSKCDWWIIESPNVRGICLFIWAEKTKQKKRISEEASFEQKFWWNTYRQ